MNSKGKSTKQAMLDNIMKKFNAAMLELRMLKSKINKQEASPSEIDRATELEEIILPDLLEKRMQTSKR